MTLQALKLPQQWQWRGGVPLVAGLFGISLVCGIGGALFAGIPALFLILTGMCTLFIPGDVRVKAYMGLASVIGVLCAVPLLFISGFWSALLFTALCVASFVVAGRGSLIDELSPEVVPQPENDLRMQAKVGFDEAVMGFFLLSARVPSGHMAARMCDEALGLEELIRKRGWDHAPETMHKTPEAPSQVNAQTARCQGLDYERISFESEFVPDPDLPLTGEWLQHNRNNRANAWMLRHPGPPRPWLVCIHGYRMGEAWIDFGLFNPRLLHRRMGLNLLMPTLPLHGPRRIGRLSGGHYLDGNLLELVLAQSQALWDLRRWLAWLRDSEDQPQIGVYGISLGGYNTGLLTGYERDLAFGVASIPVVDFAEVLWRVIPPVHKQYFEARGITEDHYRDLLRAVSPLTMPSRLPQDGRYVVAANADRIVPVGQPALLAQHWGVEARWYQGSHMSIAHEFEPRMTLEQAVKQAGWSAGTGTSDEAS